MPITPSSAPPGAGPTPALQGALLAFQNAPRSPAAAVAAAATQRADGLLTPGTSTAGSREASPMRRLTPHRAGSPRDRPRRDASPSISDASGAAAEAPPRDGDWPLRGGDWARAAPAAGRLSPAQTADSFIAANLAARSPSPARSGGADTRSIPSTTRLISMFEGAEGIPRRPSTAAAELEGGPLEGDPVKVDVPKRMAKSRANTPIGASAERQQPARPKVPDLDEPVARTLSVKPAVKPKPEIDTALLAARQVARVLGERTEAPPPASQASPRRPRPPTPPKPRGAETARTISRAVSSSTLSTPAAERDPAPTAEPAGHARRDTASSEDSFVSASSVQSPSRTSPPALDLPRTPSRGLDQPRTPARSQSPKSASTSPARRPAPPPSRNPGASSSLHVGSLSDAIVASSLASSRLTPSNTGDPTPRAQQSSRLLQTLRTGDSGADHHHHHHHSRRHHRRDDGSDEELKKRRRRSRRRSVIGGKRHSHKEGARKRWAGRISERQRRRYEALWASNRGTLVREHLASSDMSATAVGPPDPEAYVVNIVVRELWRRSRLPDDELEEVWALVDGEGSGLLGRREFVVGTWLVDQRLKGRKIPARVGDSVWDSASGMVLLRK